MNSKIIFNSNWEDTKHDETSEKERSLTEEEV
jgi:hypothetical protein